MNQLTTSLKGLMAQAVQLKASEEGLRSSEAPAKDIQLQAIVQLAALTPAHAALVIHPDAVYTTKGIGARPEAFEMLRV